jgi:hypothetical protein
MKKILFLLLLFYSSFFLQAEEPYTPPVLSDSSSVSIILLPDIQNYVKFERNQPILDLMTAWVSENINKLNVKALLCTGDLVAQNEMPVPGWKRQDQSSQLQWKATSRAFERLDGKIPYILCTGNHDYGYVNIVNRNTNLNKYFPPDRNLCWHKSLAGICNNASGIPTLENAAYEIKMYGNLNILVVSLEFAPRDEALNWAKNLCQSKKYKDHLCILLTHSYLNWDGKRIETEKYKIEKPNYGQAIWEKLVYPSSNIRMVISGHLNSPKDRRKNVGFQIDKNSSGKPVCQMVFNAQSEGGGNTGNGGDGWLRILEFLPDGKTVKVKTFSPFFAISPTTRQHAWRNEGYDQFEFVIK